MSSGRIPYARAWIRELGLQEDTEVKLVAVGVGPQAAAALKSERVRALVIYDAVYAAIEAATDVRFTRFETDCQKPLFRKQFPENKPTADKQADELKSRTAIVNSMVSNWLSGMDKTDAKWGGQSEVKWNGLQDNDHKAGLISATRPVGDYFTARFETQANAFDAEAVRGQAKSFTDDMIRFSKTK
jgi:hypothetical protein